MHRKDLTIHIHNLPDKNLATLITTTRLLFQLAPPSLYLFLRSLNGFKIWIPFSNFYSKHLLHFTLTFFFSVKPSAFSSRTLFTSEEQSDLNKHINNYRKGPESHAMNQEHAIFFLSLSRERGRRDHKQPVDWLSFPVNYM